MNRLVLIVLILAFGKFIVAGNEIKNSKYKVNYAKGRISFCELNSGKSFLKDIIVGQSTDDNQVVIENVNHPIWGQGCEMIIVEKSSGNRNKISIYEALPFIMLQRELENKTEKEQTITKDFMLKGEIVIGESLSGLKSMSTAGLKSIKTYSGGYVYLTIGNPENYNGIVCGWLTNERGSGIVFSDFVEGKAELSARIDYGDLRIPAGKSTKTETLLIGYAEDIRVGLEKYADAIASHFKITLPPMPTVYCTWYHAKASDEKKIAENTDFIAENLTSYGIDVMQIDDFWQSGIRINGPHRDFSKVNPEGPYPNGMKPTADYIKSKGLVSGIWYIPFAGTWNDSAWADKQDLFLKQGRSEFNYYKHTVGKSSSEPEYTKGEEPFVVRWGGTCLDLTNPKAQEYVRSTAERLSKDWGYRYFKMDGLWTGTGTRLQYVNAEYKDDDLGMQTRHNPAITPIEAYAGGLDLIRDSAGDSVFLLGCAQTQNMRVFGPSMGRIDAMRVGPDNGANAKGLVRGPMFSNRLFFLNKRVWYNDPDPVYVRKSFDEEMAKTSVSWTGITGSLHSSSYQYAELPPERLDILKRSIPSHTLKTVQPVDFLESDPARIWLLTDERGKNRRDVIGLFNWDIDKTVNVVYPLNRVKLPEANKYVGFDFWENKFISPFTDTISALLPPGGCKIVAIKPVTDFPQVISTSRHLTQGVIDLKNDNWDKNSKILSGESSVIGGEEYEIRLVVPSGKNSWVINNIDITGTDDRIQVKSNQTGGCIRIGFTSPIDQEISWKISFKRGAVELLKFKPVTGLMASIDLDKILVKWDKSNASGYRIIKNGRIIGEVNKELYEDLDVKLNNSYEYGIQIKEWDGKWSDTKTVTIAMPAKYDVPEVPALPDVFCQTPVRVKGNRNIKINESYSGKPLALNEKIYLKGIGVKAKSILYYNIPKDAKYFVATVGLDDSNQKNNQSSVVFRVLGDVKEMGEPLVELGRSPVLKNDGTRVWNFKIELDNRLRQVQLVVDSTQDGSSGDEANWVNAGFITSGK